MQNVLSVIIQMHGSDCDPDEASDKMDKFDGTATENWFQATGNFLHCLLHEKKHFHLFALNTKL